MKWMKDWFTRQADPPRNIQKSSLRKWLMQKDWHLFFSQTFRHGRQLEAVRSQFSRCHAVVLSRLMPRAMFYVLEPHEESQTYHVHGLLSLTSMSDFPVCRKHGRNYRARCHSCALGRRWFLNLLNMSWKRFGTLRTSFVDRTSESSINYCIKYVIKSNLSENVLWNVWTAAEGPMYTPPISDWADPKGKE